MNSPNRFIKLHDRSLGGNRAEVKCAIGAGILFTIGFGDNILHASEDSGTVGTIAFVGAIGLALYGGYYENRLERTTRQLTALQEWAMVEIQQSFDAQLPPGSDTLERHLPENPDDSLPT